MTPVPDPSGARPATRRARLMLPLSLIPAIACAQGDADPADPAGLGYRSAIESHRGVGAAPADLDAGPEDMTGQDVQTAVPDTGAAVSDGGAGATPVEDLSEPVPGGEPGAASRESGWIEPNDAVGRIGGWRTDARELYASPDGTAAATAMPAGGMPAAAYSDKAGAMIGQDAPAVADAPSASVPTLEYDSVLDDYEPYEESDGPDWVEANDAVGRIGGWRTYARELFESGDEGETE